ncbi:hypothetical protein STEG23_033355 [Scotinomys teguina]
MRAFLLLLWFAARGGALYFHIGETEKKCFIEEIPDKTTVIGNYRTQLYDKQREEYQPATLGWAFLSYQFQVLVAASLAGIVKMATNFLVHKKIWFDKFKYDDAERKFYEQMNGPVTTGSRQENGVSVTPRDISRARENIQKSLVRSSGPGASSGPGGDHSELIVLIASLEVENQNLRGVVQDLQHAISKLEARLSTLKKSSLAH